MLHLSAFYRIYHEHLASTNHFANSLLAKSNPINGTVIKTYNQTAGSGQIGRSWYSGKGKNITASIIVYPHFIPIHKQFYLSMAIALAVQKCLSDILTARVFVKWPNDIYVENKKIAGLLLQPALQGQLMKSAILGVGLNVNEVLFHESLPLATSLSQLCKKEWDLERVWASIEMNFRIYYNLLSKYEYNLVHVAYEQVLYRKGVTSTLISTSGLEYTGMIVGVNERGQLKFSQRNNVLLFNLHEVRLL